MNQNSEKIQDLFKLFLKLGFTAFGGPAAHIVMMQQEVVSKRKWFTEQHFPDPVGATNLIPCPNSTEMTMHIGRERAGWRELITFSYRNVNTAIIVLGGALGCYLLSLV